MLTPTPATPTKRELPTFADAKGRVYHLDPTMRDFRTVTTETGISLMGVLQSGEELVKFLFGSCDLLGQVLWLIVRKQAEAKGITPDDFEDSLTGDVMRSGAEAVLFATAGFYPRAAYGESVRQNLPRVLDALDQSVSLRTGEALDAILAQQAAGTVAV